MRAPHPSSLSQLSLRGVSQRYDDRTVLDQVSFSLAPGEKAGVVGDNGAGKSTLLNLLAGREQPDAGEVTVTAPGGTGYLAQSLGLPRKPPSRTPSTWRSRSCVHSKRLCDRPNAPSRRPPWTRIRPSASLSTRG